MVIFHKSLSSLLEKHEKCSKHLWNSRFVFHIQRKKISTGGLFYAVLSGHKNDNPLLNGGRTGKFLRPNSAMLRGLAANVDFFEKMVIFHEFWRFFWRSSRKCSKRLWNSRFGPQILRKKIFTGRLVYAVLSGRAKANPHLKWGANGRFF